MPRLFDGVRRLVQDFSAGMAIVEMMDGRVVRERLSTDAPTNIRRSSFDCATSVLSLDLVTVGMVDVEIGQPGSDRLHLGARPVVYLDQNQWIALAQSEIGSQRLRESERAAATRLLELARSRAVVLPLSAAHYTEAARAGGVQRLNLARTMLTHSRGWSLRHPMAVRNSELHVMFGNVGVRRNPILIPPAVVTLDPGGFWSPGHVAANPPALTGMPDAYVDLHRRLTAISSHVSVLAENVSEVFGRAEADSWARSHQAMARHMGGNPHATRYRRGLTRARFVTDLGDTLAEAARDAGLKPEGLSDWLNFLQEGAPSESSFRAMPHLGRLREVTHARLVNRDERWESNDLVDLHFLSCAAGYCDVVIGERKHVEYLRRVERFVTPGAALARNLSTGLELIEALV